MRIYLAARYSRHEEMQSVAQRLSLMGHTITSRWIWGHHKLDDHLVGTDAGLSKQLEFATDDYEDLRAANVCIVFAEQMREATRGGKHVETGMAIAWGLRIIKVGGHETVFDALPIVEHVADADELYQLLRRAA